MEKISSGGVLSVLKGVLTVVMISLIGVLIFGFIVKAFYLPTAVIKGVNQFLKVIAIFIGCFFFLRENKGLIKGILTGVISTIIIYLIFALIGGKAYFSLPFLIDVVFSLIVGAISGIVAVNVRK